MSEMQIHFDYIEPVRRARRTDPETSHRAARDSQVFASSHAGRIVNALRIYGPRTAHELSLLIGLSVVQIDRRVSELCELGRICIPTYNGEDLTRDGFRVMEAVA